MSLHTCIFGNEELKTLEYKDKEKLYQILLNSGTYIDKKITKTNLKKILRLFYILDCINVREADDSELSEIRNQKIGFVFQTHNLISKTNALKNVELPMLYAGVEKSKRIAKAKELLELVEMGDRAKHLPEELSGGQKQRVAIARAMANDPAIILADEPTGALDSKTGRLVMDLFHKLNKEKGKTIVLITHSNELAAETDRIISIKDGSIVNVENKKQFNEKTENTRFSSDNKKKKNNNTVKENKTKTKGGKKNK